MCETQCLVLSIETINRVKEREEYKYMKRSILNMQEQITANGMPMLDYVICRK